MSPRSSDRASPIFRLFFLEDAARTDAAGARLRGEVSAPASTVTRGRPLAVSKSCSPCCMGAKSSVVNATSVRSPCRPLARRGPDHSRGWAYAVLETPGRV